MARLTPEQSQRLLAGLFPAPAAPAPKPEPEAAREPRSRLEDTYRLPGSGDRPEPVLTPRLRARLLRRGSLWFALPDPTMERCGYCLRRLKPGEPGRFIWGRTARDVMVAGWCCVDRVETPPPPPPVPGQPVQPRPGGGIFG